MILKMKTRHRNLCVYVLLYAIEDIIIWYAEFHSHIYDRHIHSIFSNCFIYLFERASDARMDSDN